ncbi:MAG: hypothetical protein Q9218_002590 [Villophora microphyllina]
MATTFEPQPPSYDSLTPYHTDSNPFNDNEKTPATVQLSRAVPLNLADAPGPSVESQRFLIPSTTAHNLSFPSVPPPSVTHLIPTHEWATLTASLSAATTLSSAQKAKVIAAGVSMGIVSCWPGVGVCIGRAVCRREVEKMVSIQGEHYGYGTAAEKDNVGAVLEGWNRVWGQRGVRVGLVLPGMETDEQKQITCQACQFGLLVEKISGGEDMESGVVSPQENGAEEGLEQSFAGLMIEDMDVKKV